ncbi:hypothetical protein [Ralstonia pseudosolanacearum]|uniref:hypothetical protein n=1 Tax=Ralstonia pseudosolanacearum TaxID=1310165 RepID=UPI0018D0BED8|nr:hypothetical protein [Ralstonia pseudosolanacearum]
MRKIAARPPYRRLTEGGDGTIFAVDVETGRGKPATPGSGEALALTAGAIGLPHAASA